MPKCSIITPVYNGERFIAEAIESVLAQTMPDWELIIVDDGSTDATPEIIARFSDPRIRVLRQRNSGAASARNRALDEAQGCYIGFLDADDLYAPNALEAMVNYLETHPDFQAVYSDGIMCDQDKRPMMRLSELRQQDYQGDILEHIVLSNIITVPACVMVQRAVLEHHGLRFDDDLARSEDWDFWIRLSRYARFGYLDAVTCMYRIHEVNITRTTHADRWRLDLVRNRMKVLHSDWFTELDEDTRHSFFRHLVTQLLANDPQQQEEVMHSAHFEALSVNRQADLFRLAAASQISRHQNTDLALEWLQRSLALQPNNRKTCALLQLATMSPALAAVALSAWRVLHNAQTRVRSLGRRRPKPVPAALLPASD